MPQGYIKKQIQRAKQDVSTGTTLSTGLLDAQNASEVLFLGDAAAKVSFQATGDLAGTVEFSINGDNFGNSTAIAGSNAIASFNTHNVSYIRVNRSGGSGRLHVAAK